MIQWGWKKDRFDKRDYLHKRRVTPIPDKFSLSQYLTDVRDQGNIGCYDTETEVLTKCGWKSFKEATLNDEIATLNPFGFLQYQYPTHKIENFYRGKMYTVNKTGFNFCVTPNHNMLVRKWDQAHRTLADDLIFTRADNLGWFSAVPRTANWLGIEQEYFSIPRRENRVHPTEKLDIPIDDWLWFLGIYIAEGCVSHCTNEGNYRVEIAAVKPDKRAKIVEHLNRLPWKFTSYSDRLTCYNKRLWEELEPLEQARDKHVPQYVKEASPAKIQIFLDGFATGDGGEDGTRLYTSSKKLADDLQELILKVGAVANIIKYNGGLSKIEGRIIESGEQYLLIVKERTQSDIERKDDIRLEDYSDYVYCFEVPNHTMYVRRNGCPMWCGNSCVGFGIGINLNSVKMALDIFDEWSSPTYIYNGARYLEGTLPIDVGCYPRDALDWTTDYGILLEHHWPYDPEKLDPAAPSTERIKKATRYKCFQYFRCVDDIDGICDALSSWHFVSIGTPWFNEWMDSPTCGRLPKPTKDSQVVGGHETCLFGYNRTEGVFYGVNSWGTGWGDHGKFVMPFEAVEIWKEKGGYDAHYIVFAKDIDDSPIPEPSPSPCPFGKVTANFLNALVALGGRKGRFYYRNQA